MHKKVMRFHVFTTLSILYVHKLLASPLLIINSHAIESYKRAPLIMRKGTFFNNIIRNILYFHLKELERFHMYSTLCTQFVEYCYAAHIQHLASVGLDDHHTLNIWDWKRGKVIASTRGHSDRIFDVQFNPHSATELVTCGVKHIKFWTLRGNSLSGKKGLFGKKG